VHPPPSELTIEGQQLWIAMQTDGKGVYVGGSKWWSMVEIMRGIPGTLITRDIPLSKLEAALDDMKLRSRLQEKTDLRLKLPLYRAI
jgi:hypothetical protein